MPAVGDTRHDAVWLTIKRAELYGPLAGAEIRVTAKVNGTEFTYPTLEGVEWLAVGPQMASQQFRIPPATQYELQFNAQVRRGNSTIALINVNAIQITTLPREDRYNLYRKDGMARLANVEGAVFYKLTTEP